MLYGGLIVLIVNVCTDAEDVNIARGAEAFHMRLMGAGILATAKAARQMHRKL